MKRKKVSLLKLGILLIGSSWFLWNCSLEEPHFEQETINFTNVETVSFKDAMEHFKTRQEIKLQKRSLAKNQKHNFEVTPDWNTFQYNEIAYTQAQLTTAKSEINRQGNYASELFFIKVNGHIRNVIVTLWKDKIDAEGNIIDGRVFFNNLKGTFIDGYLIEEGTFTKQYVIQSKPQEANFLPLYMFFQSFTGEGDCWNTDVLDTFNGGVLGEVILSGSGGGNNSGGSSGPGHGASYNWYYSSGPGSSGYGAYINNATSWNVMPTGGGGGSSLSAGQITSAAAAILIAASVKPDENGNCPEGYVKNPKTGDCDPICSGGKIFNTTTKKCDCPEGKKEDTNGNCVLKPCKGNPIIGNLEIAPQKGVSGTKGALHGCTRYGGTCKGTEGRNKFHAGVDIKSPYGTPIHAMYDGFIYSTKYDNKGAGYNTRIQSTVNGKTILISYFHLQKENRILQGNPLVRVKAGDIIGYQGDSGNLKKALKKKKVDSHVHIEVREHDGSSKWGYNHFDLVDPRDYFATKIKDDGTSEPNTNCN